MADEPQTYTVTFKPGIQYQMLKPAEEASSVAYATLRAAEKDPSKWRRAVEVYFRFVRSIMLSDDDAESLEDRMISGEVKFQDIADGIEALIKASEDDSTAETKPVKRTRSAARR